MIRIKVRIDGKWTITDKFLDTDIESALDVYNERPTPRMLVTRKGIAHKQYTDNGFRYVGGPGLLEN